MGRMDRAFLEFGADEQVGQPNETALAQSEVDLQGTDSMEETFGGGKGNL